MHAYQDPHQILSQTALLERFLRYVAIDTQSDEESEGCPSSEKQWDLAHILVEELKTLGLENATVDEHGYVIAHRPGSRPGCLGWIAHIDTAPAFSGAQVTPILHANYQGGTLEPGHGVTIDPSDNPELAHCFGDTIITASGDTLLGADDKSGIAAIMAALEVLQANPEIEAPDLAICFNPDEEIGRGAHCFPLEKFGAPVAITVDGGFAGEMNVETFSADRARVSFTGVAVHPGSAKGKMVNALTWMGKLLSRLPMAETPECTEAREGFYHPTGVSGDAAACSLDLILRDFDGDVLEERGARLRRMADALRAEEPRLQVEVEITEQYRNMADGLAKHPQIQGQLRQAIEMSGVTPDLQPIRGGTDGSQLTAKGLPTPNLFAGGVNFHGPQEWISTRVMALSACTLLNLAQVWQAEEVNATMTGRS
jgi:tripeptide aminopeptidase